MKKIFIYLITSILAIVLLLFIRTLFSDFNTTSVENLKIQEGIFQDEQGNAFSGTLKAEGEEINNLYKKSIGTFPPTILSWINNGQTPEKLPKDFIDRLKGIVFHVNVEAGKLTGETEVFYDLREGKEEVFNRKIDKGLGYFTSYLFNNRISVAKINFKDGTLDGASYVVKPNISGNDAKLMEVNFNTNNLENVKRFFDNGEVRSINNYKDFLLNGSQQGFYKDGKLRYESHVENGNLVWEKYYFQKPHTLRKESTYDNNKGLVSALEFFPNGDKRSLINDSIKKEWYSNGELKMMISNDTIISNAPKGEINTYHNNGQLHTKYVYNSLGQEQGPYSIYYKNGELWEQGTMEKGEKHGNIKKWYNNKQLAEDHQMINGNRDGKYVRYYDDGQQWKEFNYKNGILHGHYKKWWKNGQIAEDHNMVDGEIDGAFISYYDNGQKWKEFNYKNGALAGVATKWWKNGIQMRLFIKQK